MASEYPYVPVVKSRFLKLEICRVSCLFLVHFFELGVLVDLRQLDMLLAVVDSGRYAKAMIFAFPIRPFTGKSACSNTR